MPVPAENPRPTTTLGGSAEGSGTGEFAPDAAGAPRPRRPRRILHLDVDAFLASVEEVLHPELRGKPLVIGGLPGERNLVMSCSYAARAYGVRPGMPLGEAQRRCPAAIFRRGDSQAANRLRERTALLVRRTTPLVEVTSIDDLFADLGGSLDGTAFETAVALR